MRWKAQTLYPRHSVLWDLGMEVDCKRGSRKAWRKLGEAGPFSPLLIAKHGKEGSFKQRIPLAQA